MTKDRWLQLIADIKDSFAVVEEDEWLDEEDRGGVHYQSITFESPLGVLRLELSDRPRLLDKKTNYSNRVGAEVLTDYVYSPTERVYELLAWRWSEEDDDWLAIELDKLSFNA